MATISRTNTRRSSPPGRVLPVRSCLIDGEAVVCNESGLAVSATDATGQALGGRPRASEDQPS